MTNFYFCVYNSSMVDTNFKNSDGTFNRQKWLDFMNFQIDDIGFYSAWTGHTAKIVNQKSKVIDFQKVVDIENKDSIISFVRQYTDFFAQTPDFFGGDRWDKDNGWISGYKDEEGITFYEFMWALRLNEFHRLPKERTFYKVAMDRKIQFVVYMPEFNAVRTLGFWEYKNLGLKKYIYWKYEEYLKKLGVL